MNWLKLIRAFNTYVFTLPAPSGFEAGCLSSFNGARFGCIAKWADAWHWFKWWGHHEVKRVHGRRNKKCYGNFKEKKCNEPLELTVEASKFWETKQWPWTKKEELTTPQSLTSWSPLQPAFALWVLCPMSKRSPCSHCTTPRNVHAPRTSLNIRVQSGVLGCASHAKSCG